MQSKLQHKYLVFPHSNHFLCLDLSASKSIPLFQSPIFQSIHFFSNKMGIQFSKKKQQQQEPSNLQADLSSYQAACQSDPQLNSFDAGLRNRATQAINSVALGQNLGTFSLDSLKDVTECLLEMNHEVLKLIFQSKKDIWKNPDLFDLVNDYFDNSLQSLDFCSSLESCLKRANYSQSILLLSLKNFETENVESSRAESDRLQFSETLEGLRKFKEAGDPFTEEFFAIFQSVYKQQSIMLEKLQSKRKKLDKKLKNVKSWKKVTNAIFVVAFVSVLICSVVAAAVMAPPVVTALAAAAALPLGTMGKWLNSLWAKCEKDLNEQKDVISTMRIGIYVVVKDLENITLLVEKLRVEIEALLMNADFGLRDDHAVEIAVEEIKKKVDGFMKSIQDLSVYNDKCSRNINRTRTMILRKIINYPSSSNQNLDNSNILFS